MPKPEFETEWEAEHYDEAKEAMSKLLNLSNAMGSKRAIVAGMLDGFVQEHRTSQQSGIRNFVSFLRVWGKEDEAAMTDMRNQEAWNFAQVVAKLDPMFPCI